MRRHAAVFGRLSARFAGDHVAVENPNAASILDRSRYQAEGGPRLGRSTHHQLEGLVVRASLGTVTISGSNDDE
jgi:hypothetical protein